MYESMLKFNPLSEFGDITNGQTYEPYLIGGGSINLEDSVRPITPEWAPFLGYKKDIFYLSFTRSFF